MDIDIDFPDRIKALEMITHIAASRQDSGNLVKHNTGVYLHSVPVDPLVNACSLPYDQAEEKGFFKIDFLNVNTYNGIRNEDHLIELMSKEPVWELLEEKSFVDLLFHVNSHDDLLKIMKPRNIEQLAAVLAMIRPAKRYLVGKSWDEVFDAVWIKPDDDRYYFKKSHATAYAVAIVVQMNMICEGFN